MIGSYFSTEPVQLKLEIEHPYPMIDKSNTTSLFKRSRRNAEIAVSGFSAILIYVSIWTLQRFDVQAHTITFTIAFRNKGTFNMTASQRKTL